MAGWQGFSGINRGYVLELYERFRQDPASVDPDTRAIFEHWTPPADDAAAAERRAATVPARAAVVGGQPRAVHPPLRPSRRAARSARIEADRRSDAAARAPRPDRRRPAPHSRDARLVAARPRSRRTCRSSSRPSAASTARRPGYDYAQVFVPEERQWLRQAAEDGRFREPADPIDPVALLERLTQVEAFERFLHRTFPGQDALLDRRARHARADPRRGDRRRRRGRASRSILIGMAHRGRLNVMAHVLCKPYEQILAEFKDPLSSRNFREDMAWAGDVKYHAGAHRAIKDGREIGARGLDAAQPEPPRSGRSRSSKGMARAAGHDSRPRRRAEVRSGAQRADPDSRRRRVPRPGHRRRDAEPEPPGRLRHRRHDPHHRQQPARVHRRRARVLQHARTRAGWRAASRSRSSTSTPTIPKPASRRRGWRSRIARSSSATS